MECYYLLIKTFVRTNNVDERYNSMFFNNTNEQFSWRIPLLWRQVC
jgi:hypothetical protein